MLRVNILQKENKQFQGGFKFCETQNLSIEFLYKFYLIASKLIEEVEEMAETYHVKGYDGFLELMKDFKCEGKMINVWFSGEKDEKVSSNLN